MKFARVNGVTLHYQLDGITDAVSLVFIHSLGTDMRLWDGVVTSLMPQFRVLRYDLRGHGLSDCPPAPYSVTELAQDLDGLMTQANIGRAILIGLSIGGLVALQMAMAYPQRVTALVLCDTAGRIGSVEYWNERINTLREHGMAYLADAILSRWFAASFPARDPASYRGFYNLLMRTPLEGYLGACAALRDGDLQASLRNINVPALALCGAEDIGTPPDVVRGLADALPDAQFQLIAASGHLPSVEQPEAMVGAIRQFLKEKGYG